MPVRTQRMMLVTAHGVALGYGGRAVLDGLEFSVEPGQRLGIKARRIKFDSGLNLAPLVIHNFAASTPHNSDGFKLNGHDALSTKPSGNSIL